MAGQLMKEALFELAIKVWSMTMEHSKVLDQTNKKAKSAFKNLAFVALAFDKFSA
jgi:hypothetical protein